MTVIDCQFHWYPPRFCELQAKRRVHPLWRENGDGYVFEPAPGRSVRLGRDFLDLERQLERFAGEGVDVVVSSPAVFGDVAAFEAGEARELAALLNDEQASAQRRYRGRFYGLAVLPLQDPELAIVVLDEAVADGLRGVLVHSNVAGGSIAAEELLPVYRRIEEHDVPLFLHPGSAFAEPRVVQFALEAPLGFMFDSTIAAVSLVLGGVLDACPRLRVVHPHLGATLPYLLERIETYERMGLWTLPRPFREYLGRFHTDTVSGSPSALRRSLELYGDRQVLFGSDVPYFPLQEGLELVRSELEGGRLEAVLEGNARRLLRLDEPTRSI